MKRTQVELPDGRALVIEGGDSESTARLLHNHYLLEGGDTPAAEEEVLDNPAVAAFENPRREKSAPVASKVPVTTGVPVGNGFGEEALALPVMSF